LHGSAFDFLRNTDLDARNYFSPTRGAYRQNQFGGTVGGPIRRDKVFYFLDYQGTRQTQGIDTGEISVPSNADRNGDLSDFVDSNGNSLLAGMVSGSYLAGLLTQKLGYTVSQGEPYYFNGCAQADAKAGRCVFANAQIPESAWSVPAQRMLQYIPAANNADGFATSAYDQTVRDDKAGARIDAYTRLGLLSGYYFVDDFNLQQLKAGPAFPASMH